MAPSTQALFVQIPLGHVRPQPPQFCGSLLISVHRPLQKVAPGHVQRPPTAAGVALLVLGAVLAPS